MKNSGYRTGLHISFLYLFSLLGILFLGTGLFFLLITVQKPDGSAVKSDWPIYFTRDFREQIFFLDGKPQVKQTGIELLLEDGIGLQILDSSGQELFSFQKPDDAGFRYSYHELLQLGRDGHLAGIETSAFIGQLSNEGTEYAYLLHFPLNLTTVTMYLNGERFTHGKTIIFGCIGILFAVAVLTSCLYGLWTTRTIGRLTASVRDITTRSYLPVPPRGAFGDIRESLNILDDEIKTADRLRIQTEQLRKEWIANITHDLKTPLAPIKGYAELLAEADRTSLEQCKRYAQIMMKNASYMEKLLNDLKLTYQLESGMAPFHPQAKNIIRFLREIVIDLLNSPAYENRCIHFESSQEELFYSFDAVLLTRAFQNLMINAFVHGTPETEVSLKAADSESCLIILVADNGEGMTEAEVKQLFSRYYRGTNTEQKTEGTGLGLAIVKSIVELHAGTISAASMPGFGTTFEIRFPHITG